MEGPVPGLVLVRTLQVARSISWPLSRFPGQSLGRFLAQSPSWSLTRPLARLLLPPNHPRRGVENDRRVSEVSERGACEREDERYGDVLVGIESVPAQVPVIDPDIPNLVQFPITARIAGAR